MWGAYFAGYGFNAVVPARGGDVIRLFLTRNAVPGSSYSAIAAAFAVEFVFDLTIAVPVLAYAFSQGVFPKPPDFSELPAFDLAFFASNPRFTLFLLTVIGIGVLIGFALMSARVRAFWARVRQGLTILFDRRRYFREVWLVQFAGWLCRFAAFWFLLEAFNVGGSVSNVLLVLGVNAVAALVPFTPGGAGVQQALLVKVFGSGATVAAYSVGQQIAIAALTFGLGLASVIWIFKFRSFKEVIRAGRAEREAEKAAEPAGDLPARARAVRRARRPRVPRSPRRAGSGGGRGRHLPPQPSGRERRRRDGPRGTAWRRTIPQPPAWLRPRRARAGDRRRARARPGPPLHAGRPCARRGRRLRARDPRRARPADLGPGRADTRRAARGRRRRAGGAPRGTVTHVFPTAEAIAAAPDSAFAMPERRKATLRALAGTPLDELISLPGVGPWTQAYVAMRALRDRDAWLPTDLGVRHALSRLGPRRRRRALAPVPRVRRRAPVGV